MSVPRHRDSDRLSVLRSRPDALGSHTVLARINQPCGAAGQERILAQMQEGDARRTPSAADRPQPNQSKDHAGVSGRRYRAGSANSKGNRKQRKKRKSRACMARAPDLRRCRCNLRLRYLRYLRFPFLASMRYPTHHDPCGKRFRRNSALRAVHRENNRGLR